MEQLKPITRNAFKLEIQMIYLLSDLIEKVKKIQIRNRKRKQNLKDSMVQITN